MSGLANRVGALERLTDPNEGRVLTETDRAARVIYLLSIVADGRGTPQMNRAADRISDLLTRTESRRGRDA
jgi:hypothetical protein